MTVNEELKVHSWPTLRDGRMVLALSGWMDGGDVSTGTVNWLATALGAKKVAEIEPEPFYIYSFPGSMEISALFRPHTKIEDGVVTAYEPPTNIFYCDGTGNVLFCGKEAHFRWREFSDCLFTFASRAGVTSLYFIGSVASAVPHTRQPRLMSAVSDESVKAQIERYVTKFTDYEGPASLSTYLLAEAHERGLRMASLVAEIPAYVQGTNPKCIETVVRRLAAILDLKVDLDPLRSISDAWEKRVNRALESQQDLTEYIRKLEADYDNEVFDTQMDDLKEWLQQRGIRLD